MDEQAEVISGEVVKMPPAADMRYESGHPDAVARVFVRVEYADGRIREYQAREPQGFQVSEGMSVRKTGLSFPAGGGFGVLSAAVPSLRVSFTANPRHNLHIRTEATAPADFEGITYGTSARPSPTGAAARSTPAEYRDCGTVTDKHGKEWKYSEPSDTWCVVDNHMGPGSVSARSAASWQRLQSAFGPLQG